MRSRFWAFVEACDETSSLRAVKDLLTATMRDIGVERFALTTHLPTKAIRSFAVQVCNWPAQAVDHLFKDHEDGWINPLFESSEKTGEVIHWSDSRWRAGLRKDQRAWLDQLHAQMGRHGVTRAVHSVLVSASCSITTVDEIEADRIRLAMRIANYAYQHIQVLQRPLLSEPDRLTAREHECLYRAALCGERPSAVARRLGVKVSTVRTLRQKAYGRLDANSPEEAVWRMMETGQLFKPGRKSKPRSS